MTEKTPTSMRVLPKTPTLTRRSFMQGGGLAAISVAVMMPQALAKPARSMPIAAFATLGPASAATLLVVARDIFPHDRLAERYYIEAIRPYETSSDKALQALMREGVQALDHAARVRHGQPYAAVAAEAERVALLKEIETGPFFQKLRGDMVTSLYDNKAVWPLLGYEGSSWEKGGYLQRGFNDLDWL